MYYSPTRHVLRYNDVIPGLNATNMAKSISLLQKERQTV